MFYLPKLLNLSEGFLLLEIPLFLTLYETKKKQWKAVSKQVEIILGLLDYI